MVDVLDYLEETQCTWFFLELAKAYKAVKNFGETLVCCHRINNIFQVYC